MTVLGRVVGEPLGASVRFALVAVVGTVLLVYTSPALTLILMLAVPPIAVAAWILGGRVKVLSATTQQAYAEAGSVAEESLGGIRTVRAFSQEPAAQARYREKLAAAVEAARQRILANSARSGVSFVVGEAAALFGLWAGASLILQGRLTSGAVISFVLYGLLVARGLRRASDFWGEALRGPRGDAVDLRAARARAPDAGRGRRTPRARRRRRHAGWSSASGIRRVRTWRR